MSDRTIRKIDAQLDAMENIGKLTPEGRQWLIAAVDPFHDFDVSVKGYPDTNTAASVVQCVKETMTIQVPPGITTGTWDCNIVSLPWMTGIGMQSYGITSTGVGTTYAQNAVLLPTPGQANHLVGGVTAFANQTGQATDFVSAQANGQISCLAIADSYFQGASRVIAAGFEVVNTTSELNLQGQVICYKYPQPKRTATTFMHLDSATQTHFQGCGSYYNVNPWPSNPQNAMLLPGSRQWVAKEGAYCTCTLNDVTITNDGETYSAPMIVAEQAVGVPSTTAVVPVLGDAGSTGANLNGLNSLYPSAALNSHGAYFTGLSLQTTLSVTLNVFVERFPSIGEKDLVVLAQPSPRYDIMALEMYSHCLHNMPPGVMVKENGLGEWFQDVISRVNKIFGGAVRSIPHPYAQALGGALDAGDALMTYIAPPNAKVGSMRGGQGEVDEDQRRVQRRRQRNNLRKSMGFPTRKPGAPPLPPGRPPSRPRQRA